jgi:ribosomal protein S18 acetylase RimI-like enzyme
MQFDIPYQLRPVTQEDADYLAALEIAVFPENAFNERTLAGELALGFGWMITQEQQPVAYALVRDDGDLLDLIRLGVDPNHQGKGLGLSLLNEVLKIRRRAILTVRTSNSKALRLYSRNGFKIVGQLSDSWVMLLQPT